MLNPPASVQSAQHGLTVQVRSSPPKAADKDASQLFIPPMTPVFRTTASTHSFSKFAQHTHTSGTWNPVQRCHAQHLDDDYSNVNFVGVSSDGLLNHHDVAKHGEKMSHFTVTTRGIVTVMCDYEDACTLKLLSHVKVAKSTRRYRGMPMKTPFTLEMCTGGDDTLDKSIGIVISKPNEVNRANEVRLLLL